MKIETAIGIFVLQIAFFCGVFWAVTRAELARARKDLNNLGDKNRQLELKLLYSIVMICPEEKRQEVLNALMRRLT